MTKREKPEGVVKSLLETAHRPGIQPAVLAYGDQQRRMRVLDEIPDLLPVIRLRDIVHVRYSLPRKRNWGEAVPTERRTRRPHAEAAPSRVWADATSRKRETPAAFPRRARRAG